MEESAAEESATVETAWLKRLWMTLPKNCNRSAYIGIELRIYRPALVQIGSSARKSDKWIANLQRLGFSHNQ